MFQQAEKISQNRKPQMIAKLPFFPSKNRTAMFLRQVKKIGNVIFLVFSQFVQSEQRRTTPLSTSSNVFPIHTCFSTSHKCTIWKKKCFGLGRAKNACVLFIFVLQTARRLFYGIPASMHQCHQKNACFFAIPRFCKFFVIQNENEIKYFIYHANF